MSRQPYRPSWLRSVGSTPHYNTQPQPHPHSTSVLAPLRYVPCHRTQSSSFRVFRGGAGGLPDSTGPSSTSSYHRHQHQHQHQQHQHRNQRIGSMGNLYSGQQQHEAATAAAAAATKFETRRPIQAERRSSAVRRSRIPIIQRRWLGGGADRGGGGGGTTAAEGESDGMFLLDNNMNQAHDGYGPLPTDQASPVLRVFSKQALQKTGIKIARLRVGIDKRLTVVDEKSNSVLKYRTPHFRAMATIEIPPLQVGERLQIGWIQVCVDMQFINAYGLEGVTSWEFPEIVTGKYKMISDADGKKYPWYGSRNEVITLEGPTPFPTSATIHMNDNFFPQVTWYIPHPAYPRDPALTYVYRKQRFLTFLAVKDLTTNSYQTLKSVTWSMELAIEVNPQNELGQRAKLLGPAEQERPRILDEKAAQAIRVERYALNPPNANNSQVLVWRPRYGEPSLIIGPVQTTVDIARYLIATDELTQRLLLLARRLQTKREERPPSSS